MKTITKIEDIGITFDKSDFNYWPNIASITVADTGVQFEFNTLKDPVTVAMRPCVARPMALILKGLSAASNSAIRDDITKILRTIRF